VSHHLFWFSPLYFFLFVNVSWDDVTLRHQLRQNKSKQQKCTQKSVTSSQIDMMWHLFYFVDDDHFFTQNKCHIISTKCHIISTKCHIISTKCHIISTVLIDVHIGLNFFDFYNILEIGDLSISVVTTVSILVLVCAKVLDLSSWI